MLLRILMLLSTVTNITCDDITDSEVSFVQTENVVLTFEFYPGKIENLEQDDNKQVDFNITVQRLGGYARDQRGNVEQQGEQRNTVFTRLIYVTSDDPDVAEIYADNDTVVLPISLPAGQDRAVYSYAILIRGVFLGRTFLRLKIENPDSENAVLVNYDNKTDGSWDDEHTSVQATEDINVFYRIGIIRPLRVIDNVFVYTVSLFVIASNIGMGCKIDLSVIRRVLKRPVAPVAGFISQFGFMPIVSAHHSLTHSLTH